MAIGRISGVARIAEGNGILVKPPQPRRTHYPYCGEKRNWEDEPDAPGTNGGGEDTITLLSSVATEDRRCLTGKCSILKGGGKIQQLGGVVGFGTGDGQTFPYRRKEGWPPRPPGVPSLKRKKNTRPSAGRKTGRACSRRVSKHRMPT